MLADPPRVHLLDADPDLARNLDEVRAHAALRQLTVPLLQLRRGAWTPPDPASDGQSPPLGVAILDGLIVREATVGEHPCAELLGPGDFVHAGPEPETDELLPRRIDWTVLAPARVAPLDTRFVASAAPWPEILVTLLDRAARRADRLAVLQAITHLTRVDDRLHALLWYLAERWGRVGPDGVTLSLRLPHRTLAGMVGARRPSVTTALGQLLARGDVERRADGAWVLRGGPPQAPDGLASPAPLAQARA